MRHIPLKYVAKIIAGQAPPSEYVEPFTEGLPFLQGNAEFGDENPTPRFQCSNPSKKAEAGDILISVRAPVGALNVANCSYGIGRGLCAVRAQKCNPRFLWWWLHSQVNQLNSMATGTTYRAVTAEDIGALLFPDIALEEQRRIADFLDGETALITRWVELRKLQQKLLEERVRGLVTRSYTEAAAKYGCVRLRHVLWRIEQGWSPDCENRQAGPGEWGVVKAGCVNGGFFRPEEHKTLPAHLEPRLEYELCEGDFLMSRASGSLDLIGSVAVVPKLERRLLLCDKIYRIQLNRRKVIPEFVAHMMRSIPVREQIQLGTSGASGLANNLPAPVVRDLPIPLPPIQRQEELVRDLDQEIALINQAKRMLDCQLDLLAERRQALITAAVTGQIDVTTASGVRG
ncbi:restriction endonuclease subunit S [Carbonactinospora thermoautotrophica]|uniref:restriction endonuclease subunit S n=1 Tax=Carbonactinospora thermoautotrophica TaxID=1469144 RepID=UPI00099F20C0|nr:restriction endonuclease subunit S [Carbonactinospora thermoautotrophica]